MIVVDANLLIYAYNAKALQHVAAKRWLESAFGKETSVGLPLQSVTAFLRIITDKKLHRSALSALEATAIVDLWLAQSNVRLLNNGDNHWLILRDLLTRYNITGKLISDAQIVAITLEHGGRLVSADNDFRRFDEVRFQNPLAVRR